MAKETCGIRFSNAIISVNENGEFIVEEIRKDESIITNLTNKLKDYANIEGLTISIGRTKETESEE